MASGLPCDWNFEKSDSVQKLTIDVVCFVCRHAELRAAAFSSDVCVFPSFRPCLFCGLFALPQESSPHMWHRCINQIVLHVTGLIFWRLFDAISGKRKFPRTQSISHFFARALFQPSLSLLVHSLIDRQWTGRMSLRSPSQAVTCKIYRLNHHLLPHKMAWNRWKFSWGKKKKSCTFVLPNFDPCIHTEVKGKAILMK